MLTIKQNFYDLHETLSFLKFATTAVQLFCKIRTGFGKHTDLEPGKGMMRRIEDVTQMKMLDAFIATTKMKGFLTK